MASQTITPKRPGRWQIDRIVNINNSPSVAVVVARNASATNDNGIGFTFENDSDGSGFLDAFSSASSVRDDSIAAFRLNARETPRSVWIGFRIVLFFPPSIDVFSLSVDAKGFVVVEKAASSCSLSFLDAQLQIFRSPGHRASEDLVPIRDLVAFAGSLLLKYRALVRRSEVGWMVHAKLCTASVGHLVADHSRYVLAVSRYGHTWWQWTWRWARH